MKLEEIQNPALKKLIEEDLRHASGTISADFDDALEKSSTEEELIENWQSALMDLYNECQHYWGSLEGMKPKETDLHKLIAEGRAPPPGVIYPDRCNATTPHENREYIVHRCELPKGHEGPHQCIFCRHKWKNQNSKLNIGALKTVKFSEPDPRSLRY